jgi:adenylate cyclase
MERTLVALWFADIAGYSEHAAKDESGALCLVQILQELASETVPQFRGRVVKFVGDAVLAQFPSAELAVRAAIMLSNGYVQRSDAIGRIEHLRIGVHLADVAVAADGDLYGDGVNTAARIQEAAEPGQVVISQDVWRQLRGRPEFRFEHLGDRSLKGIGSMGLYVGRWRAAPRMAPNRVLQAICDLRRKGRQFVLSLCYLLLISAPSVIKNISVTV